MTERVIVDGVAIDGYLLTYKQVLKVLGIPDTYNPNATMRKDADGVTRWN